MSRRLLLSLVGAALALSVVAGPAAAGGGNPSGTGPPSQSCQDLGTYPGHAANSPGSPFNEPGIGSLNGGTGGLHYSANSQYDVACYHAGLHH
jgi:hypothetical protein